MPTRARILTRWEILGGLLLLGTALLPGRTDPAQRASADQVEPAQAQGKDQTPDSPQNDKGAIELQPEFAAAGVCARCHVASVLEWGVSGHLAEEVDCQECHGPSRRHVENERNEVKPDRVPRDEKIARLCLDCHESGCPDTMDVTNCQSCHHNHALVHPERPQGPATQRLEKMLARWETAKQKMTQGEELLKMKRYAAARDRFAEALRLNPGDRQARQRVAFCRRRIDPTLPGFEIVDDRFDPVTGLPLVVREPITDLKMVLIPPGTFEMGAEPFPDSRPVHTVRIEPFYLSVCEITQKQWTQWMGENPSEHQGERFPNADALPVERISWRDCQTFIARINARVPGGGFRLPTEAQWEYAARAGSGGLFAPESLDRIAWFGANTAEPLDDPDGFRSVNAFAPRPVAAKAPNAWGLHDMQGNVWEWCSSLWRPYVFDPTDGRESLSAEGMRVLRGGGFADPAESLHPGFRHRQRPDRRFRWNGLRLARSVPPPTAAPAKNTAPKK